MNSLYTLALRQSSSLQTDLTLLEQTYSDLNNNNNNNSSSVPASLHGQINASLSALDRTIEDYDSMARREIVEVKKEKAMSRVARFKDDYASLRKQYEKIKTNGANQRAQVDRSNLLSSSSTSSALNASNYASTSRTSSRNIGNTAESPFPRQQYQLNNPPGSSNNSNNNAFDNSVHNNPRTRGALDESGFMRETGNVLDGYLEQGRLVLDGLATQREMLKGTKRKLLSAANTLGLSRNTIQFIERRTTGDFYILCAGAFVTLASFYFILKYLG